MDPYLSIFQAVLSTEETYLDIYLAGLEHHKDFDIKANGCVELVEHVNSLLTKSSTRSVGLRLLFRFLDDFSNDIFAKMESLWIPLILKAYNNHELKCDTPLIIEVLEKVVKRSTYLPELKKSFASEHLNKVYEGLTTVTTCHVKYALGCMETCLRAYPGSSGPSKVALERFLWKYVDHIDVEVIQNSGKCLHLLQQVKGGGLHAVSNKSQWKSYHIQLLGGIHAVYSEMFANCVEIYDGIPEGQNLPWESLTREFDTEPVKKIGRMYTRCRNLIKYLIISLREPCRMEKPIMIKRLLNVIVRGLSVKCIMLEKNPNADNIALSILLPKIHVHLLELLNVAFLILRGHLRPYVELILSLTADSLKWTSAKIRNGSQKQLVLRKAIYETISLWCKVMHGGNRCDTIVEYLFQEIFNDITPTQSQFTLKVFKGDRKHLSKRARRQLRGAPPNVKSSITETQSGDGNKTEQILDQKNYEMCISALHCIQEILFSVGNFIKPAVLKVIQMHILRICASFYEISSKFTHLYSNKNCRIEIYNTLYAILMSPHHISPPPTEMALTILQTAYVRDESVKVRTRCGFILKKLENIIHPQKECLFFTTKGRNIRNTFINMGEESLLSEYELNPSQTRWSGIRIDDDNDLQHKGGKTSQYSNISLAQNYDKDGDNFFEGIEVIQTKNFTINETEPSKDHVTVTLERQSMINKNNDGNTLTKHTNTQAAKDDILKKEERVEDKINEGGPLTTVINARIKVNNIDQPTHIILNPDEDIATVHVSEPNINEPVTKKQKLINDNVVANKVEPGETKNSKTNSNDEDILADIASQFVDELN